MSLFKARDWWSVSIGEEDEEFDHGCLCVGNIDNSPGGQDKIVVGSFHGLIRIFKPFASSGESGATGGSKTDDTMLEIQLNLPVIQVAIGKFSSVSENHQLAVLHPRKLSIYAVASSQGSVQHGSQYLLNKLYEHSLQRTAFNFCHGAFGGVKGKDFVCVQSMDGCVSVYEHEVCAFSRFLPGALLPGPLQYMPMTDSFLTISSSRQLESYKYQTLAIATESKTKEESENLRSGKRVLHDWCFNLGEEALDISTVVYPHMPPSILVLGERNLFCFTDAGRLKYLKKIEYTASCFCPYASLTEGSINYAIATHTGSVMVYQDVRLQWAAKLEHTPVQICIANFSELHGVIVTLTDTGWLQCSYLGTDPSLFTTTPSEAREINYSDADAEMATLHKSIKESALKNPFLPNVSSEDDLSIIPHVNPELDAISVASHPDSSEPSVPSITVRLQFKSRILLENVKVTVTPHWPIAVNQAESIIDRIEPSKPCDLFVSFFMSFSTLPASLTARITALHTNTTGAPRIANCSVRLPFKLVVSPTVPEKNAEFKITIDTNKAPVNLSEIFPDLAGENLAQGMALGFQFYGGPVVTVLVSKTSQRYRLQCERFDALWMPTIETVLRLQSLFSSRDKATDFKVSFSGNLPLQELFDLIDIHFECRVEMEGCREMLSQRSAQFRSIQRRLLTKFKDKTPAALANLDTLLEGTYRQILALADAIEERKLELAISANNLSSAVQLFNLLVSLWLNMTQEEKDVLNSTITPDVMENQQQGWEDIVDAAITHQLRTSLSKITKDQTMNPAPLALPQDTNKLKKHIALLCDRLGKGASLTYTEPSKGKDSSQAPRAPMSSSLTTLIEHDSPRDNQTEDTAAVPARDQYVEKKKKKKNKSINSLSNKLSVKELAPLHAKQNFPDIMERGLMDDPDHGLNNAPIISSKDLSSPARTAKIASLVPDLDDMGPATESSDKINGIMNGDEYSKPQPILS